MSRAVLAPRWLEDALLIRQEPGHRDGAGNWVAGTEIASAIKVVTYPAPASDERRSERRMNFREGARIVDARYFLTEDLGGAPLRTGETETDPDSVVWRAARWTILTVDRWYEQGFLRLQTLRQTAFQVAAPGAAMASGGTMGATLDV